MAVNTEAYQSLISRLKEKNVSLVAVSKLKPVEDIKLLYDLGQRDFGENYVQELLEKIPLLPQDIRWHFIGHLQSNKARQIAGRVQLIHGVDSLKLLGEINKQGKKLGKKIACLLQVHIAREETKFGFSPEELRSLINSEPYKSLMFVDVKGLMGMASMTEDQSRVAFEFKTLSDLFKAHQQASSWEVLSMGMSGDFELAIDEGSNMVRIGSLLFGQR